MFDGAVVMVAVAAVFVVWLVVDFQSISLSTISVCNQNKSKARAMLQFYLGKTKINENTRSSLIAVEEVVWFDIPMNDLSCMKMTETCQERTHITTNVICCHFVMYMLIVK